MVFLYDSGLNLVQFVGHDVTFCDKLGRLDLNSSVVDKLLILKGVNYKIDLLIESSGMSRSIRLHSADPNRIYSNSLCNWSYCICGYAFTSTSTIYSP